MALGPNVAQLARFKSYKNLSQASWQAQQIHKEEIEKVRSRKRQIKVIRECKLLRIMNNFKKLMLHHQDTLKAPRNIRNAYDLVM